MKITPNTTLSKVVKYRILYLFLLPAIVTCILFSYLPMAGVVMAFQNYDIVKGIFGSPMIGLANFKEFLGDPSFYEALRNTLVVNGLSMVIGFPLPIIFALMIFSMKDSIFKRVSQTISYLPHFISWVVVAGLLYKILDQDSGIINIILQKVFNHPTIPFMGDSRYFWAVAIISGIWKELGWYTIIYLAALSGVDAEQYESAMIDGVNGAQKLFYITLPNISSTITLVLIFTAGTLINSNSVTGYFVFVPYDAIYNLRNPLISSTANTIDYFIYQTGMLSMRYSYSAAVGLVQSVISFLMVVGANYTSKKIRGYQVF